MQCPSCHEEITDPSSDVCQYCGLKLNISNHQNSIPQVKPAGRTKLPETLDFVALIDRTGSSRAYAQGIPLTHEKILNSVKNIVVDVKCSTASYGDKDEGMPYVLHSDGVDTATAINDVKQIVFEGGGVPHEHHLDGIEETVNLIPWQQDHSKGRGVLIVFSTADTKPATSGITAAELGKKIKDKKILLYLVTDGLYPYVHDLLKEANAFHMPISNSPDPEELNDLANRLTASIQASIARNPTIPMPVAA